MEPLRFNNLEVRLARDEADMDAAQSLRYRVFYEEMGAKPSLRCRNLARDINPFDEVCDHLLVVDIERSGRHTPCVVGTYRLLRNSVAESSTGF